MKRAYFIVLFCLLKCGQANKEIHPVYTGVLVNYFENDSLNQSYPTSKVIASCYLSFPEKEDGAIESKISTNNFKFILKESSDTIFVDSGLTPDYFTDKETYIYLSFTLPNSEVLPRNMLDQLVMRGELIYKELMVKKVDTFRLYYWNDKEFGIH